MRIVTSLLRALQVLLLLIGVIWLSSAMRMAGSYLATQVLARLIGSSAIGKVESVIPNPEIQTVANNYIARVTFTASDGRALTQEFRYAEPSLQGSNGVTIFYLPSNPRISAMKEDAGYFTGTLGVLAGIGGFLVVSFLAVMLVRRWMLKKCAQVPL